MRLSLVGYENVAPVNSVIISCWPIDNGDRLNVIDVVRVLKVRKEGKGHRRSALADFRTDCEHGSKQISVNGNPCKRRPIGERIRWTNVCIVNVSCLNDKSYTFTMLHLFRIRGNIGSVSLLNVFPAVTDRYPMTLEYRNKEASASSCISIIPLEHPTISESSIITSTENNGCLQF